MLLGNFGLSPGQPVAKTEQPSRRRSCDPQSTFNVLRSLRSRFAVPFLQQVEPGERPKLPKSIKRLSLNEMAAFVAEEAETE